MGIRTHARTYRPSF